MRYRLRDLGYSVGKFKPGKWNAITDVPGVKVGQVTLIEGANVRTGVTAILPCGGREHVFKPEASAFVLNGAGEMIGLTQVREWGMLETPILLTNTHSIGKCADTLVREMIRKNPSIGDRLDPVIPLVAECDDSWLNDAGRVHLKDSHILKALRGARGGPISEGAVGAGTGMISFGFKSGIGTASRKLPKVFGGYTLGVLVLSNFGRKEDLRFLGEQPFLSEAKSQLGSGGSIITVVATNAPILSSDLERLCKRAALGIGRVGGNAYHQSGDIVIAISTTQSNREMSKARLKKTVGTPVLNALFAAAAETTEEAILNSLCKASAMKGRKNRVVPELPISN